MPDLCTVVNSVQTCRPTRCCCQTLMTIAPCPMSMDSYKREREREGEREREREREREHLNGAFGDTELVTGTAWHNECQCTDFHAQTVGLSTCFYSTGSRVIFAMCFYTREDTKSTRHVRTERQLTSKFPRWLKRCDHRVQARGAGVTLLRCTVRAGVCVCVCV